MKTTCNTGDKCCRWRARIQFVEAATAAENESDNLMCCYYYCNPVGDEYMNIHMHIYRHIVEMREGGTHTLAGELTNHHQQIYFLRINPQVESERNVESLPNQK